YWDDIHVTDASSFETGASGVAFGTGAVAPSTAVARSGASSLSMSGNSSGIYQDLAGLTPGALYQVTVYAHGDPGATNQGLIVVHDSANGNIVADGWRTPGNGWDAFTVTFLASAAGRMRIVLLPSRGSGALFWDDIHVTDASGFETGASVPGTAFG